MNRLELSVQHHQELDRPEVRILIDGQDLVVLVRGVEAASARVDGQPQLAGGYTGLYPEQWADLPEAYGDGRVAVLGCECGEVGCWPLRVRVDREGQTVTWSGFQQPYRPAWSYAGLGPFVFDRAEYDAQLRRVAAAAARGEA